MRPRFRSVGGRFGLAVAGLLVLTALLAPILSPYAPNGIDLLTHVRHGARLSLGLVDEALMRLTDVLLAFPGILLAIFITAVLGPSLTHVVFALSFTGWTGYARLARAQVLTLRERDYVQATSALPGAILAEASLSFLGLGAPPGTPSWGALVDQGTQYLLVAPHVALFPGLALALTVLGFHLLGDAVRDTLDPKHLEHRP